MQRLGAEDRRLNIRAQLANNQHGGTMELLLKREPLSALKVEWSQVEGETPPTHIFSFRNISDEVSLHQSQNVQTEFAEAEARFEARHSLCPVTGLTQRPNFLRELEQLFSENHDQLVGLVIFDLIAMRLINDRHGYATGDEFLAEIGRRLKEAAREQDVVARFDGNQFAVLANLASTDELALMTNRLRMEIESKPFLPRTTTAVIELRTRTHVGAAVARVGKGSAAQLVRGAEMSLIRSKAGRESQITDTETSNDDLQSEVAVSTAVHHCLQHNLIPIALQPMVLMESGEVYGYEALARPVTDTGSPVPVYQFMDLAEKLGLMQSVGELLIRSTFDTFRRARLAEARLRLSLNLSPSQFAMGGISTLVQDIARQFKVPLGLLTTEITETALVSDEDILSREVTELRSAGVKVLLDDFGTGFSSLNWIFNVPTDGIKIDRSYTSRIDEPHRRLVMLNLARMCRDLDLEVVVEGVENDIQRKLLIEMGFQQAQGYLFGRPQTLEQMMGL